MSEEKPKKKKSSLSTAFVWFHATSVNGGAMAIAATISSYFSLYVQNNIGITAAQLSVILLICSLWDAINDPIMGVICDSINPKQGRYRIWFTFTPIFLLVDMFLLFSNPGFIQGSAMAKCVYVCITYMFYGMIVTAYTMPQMAILPAMTLDDEERNDVVSKGAAVCALAFTIASTFSTQLVELVGSYRTLMCMYAVLAVISFWGLYKTSEERYVAPKAKGDGGLKQLIYVFRHKEIWPVMLVWCLGAISYGFMFSSSVYYAQYVLVPVRVDLATMDEATIGSLTGTTISVYMGFISVGALISMMFVMPFLLKKLKAGYKAIIVSQIATIVCYALLFFTGTLNFWYCCILSFVATVVGAQINALVNVLVNDTIDFILLKEQKQLNGIVSSVKGFAQKCGNTVTNSGILAILAICGFSTDYGIFGQPDSAVTGTIVTRFLVPMLVSVVILIICLFYPLKKYFPAIAEMKANMAVQQAESGSGSESGEEQ